MIFTKLNPGKSHTNNIIITVFSKAERDTTHTKAQPGGLKGLKPPPP